MPQITTNDFRAYMGLATQTQPGRPSVGLLVLTRLPANTSPLTIEKDTVWSSGGLGFVNPEPWEVSESAQTFEFAVQSRLNGEQYNLPANSPWPPLYPGFRVENPNAFVGGADEVKGLPGYFPISGQDGRPSDQQLQLHLDAARPLVKDMIGKKDTELNEDDPRVRTAILMLATYRFQNRDFQQKMRPVPQSFAESEAEKSLFRDRMYMPLLRQIGGLLCHLTDYKRHILGDTDETA